MLNKEEFEAKFNEPLTDELRELITRDLPKWPGLVVVGEPVTLEQAEEIIIRTTSFHFSTNDRSFQRDLYRSLGTPLTGSDGYSYPEFNILTEVEKKYQVLHVDYLRNSRICSCYVGGPHGWCDWEGNIGCNSYNIGKWPSVDGVVLLREPEELKQPESTLESDILRIFTPGGERGCTISKFEHALQTTLKAVSK